MSFRHLIDAKMSKSGIWRLFSSFKRSLCHTQSNKLDAILRKIGIWRLFFEKKGF